MDESDHRRLFGDLDASYAETKSHEQAFIGLTEIEAEELAERLGLELRVIRDEHTALSPRSATTADHGGRSDRECHPRRSRVTRNGMYRSSA